MERMEVHYQPEGGDLVDAKTSLPFIWRWLMSGGLLSIMVLAILPGTVLLLVQELYVGIVVTWMVVGLVIVGTFALQQKMNQSLEERIDSVGEVTMTLQPDGLVESSKRAWTRRSWYCVRDIKSTKRNIVIRSKSALIMFHIVPLDAFSSLVESQQFIALAEGYRRDIDGATPRSWLPMPVDNPGAVLAKIDFETNQNELVRFYSSGDPPADSFIARNVNSILFGMLAVVTGFLWICANDDSTPLDKRERIIGELWGTVLLVASFLFSVWLSRMMLRQIMKTELRTFPLCKETLTITKEGVLAESSHLQSWQSWLEFDRITETIRFIAFWQGAAATHLIPKRAFASAEQARHFFQLAKEALHDILMAHDDASTANFASVKESGNPYQPPRAT